MPCSVVLAGLEPRAPHGSTEIIGLLHHRPAVPLDFILTPDCPLAGQAFVYVHDSGEFEKGLHSNKLLEHVREEGVGVSNTAGFWATWGRGQPGRYSNSSVAVVKGPGYTSSWQHLKPEGHGVTEVYIRFQEALGQVIMAGPDCLKGGLVTMRGAVRVKPPLSRRPQYAADTAF